MNPDEQLKFKNLYDNLSDGILLIDEGGVIRFANKAAIFMLGSTRENLVGKEADQEIVLQCNDELVTRDTSPIHKVLNERIIYSTDQESGKRYTMARNDRSLMPVNMIILPHSAGIIDNGITILFHDLASDEKVERAKNEFIALISHQLRTPINIISWYVEKLVNGKHGELNDQQKGYLQEIYNSNHRVVDLVQAIVNVSRTDLNRIRHKHEEANVRELLERSINEIMPMVTVKNITIQKDIEDHPFKLSDSDQELVFVALRNVLNNAIRYTQDGGNVSIALKWIKALEPLDSTGEVVSKHDGALLTIRDSGIGIPDEDKNFIFKKLFRGSNVQALDVTGVGLGLYISNTFMKELGGLLWYESELREGSTFHLFFPESTGDNQAQSI
jgi:two-component system, OmpR family, sensor histidine kinase VicK